MTQDDKTLPLFKELILNTCGFSLEMGREQTLLNSVRERMALTGLGAADYYALLIRDRREMSDLVELLTVNETYFFREPGHLSVAVDKLLPECLSRSAGKPVRILSAGCSTGEEPYTLAMMLRERYGADSQRLFAITGVDIDAGAIGCARVAAYGRSSFRHMDPGMLERYFESAGPAEFRVREGIRELVDFEVVNLLGPSYPQGMREPDLIFYRNVSIYFPQQVQQKIFTSLAGVLKCEGYLIVGASETIHHNTGILSLVECDSLFFYHKSGAALFKERRLSGQDAPVYERRQQAKPTSLSLKPTSDRTGTDAGGNRPEQEGHLFDKALGLARSGQSEKALQLLAELLGREPSFAKALILRGSLLLSAARYDEALEVCHRILALDPLCLEACLMLGMIARHQGKNDDAFRHFREAVYLDASCWLAHFYSAEILFAQGDAKRARTGYETASRLLGKGAPDAHGQAVFQLSFNAEQFIVICRHKLSLLKENR